jgi:neutral trehalase
MSSVRFQIRDVLDRLDRNTSGHVTIDDLPRRGGLKLKGKDERGRPIVLRLGAKQVGLAARIFEYTKRFASDAGGWISIPRAILEETPTARALLACDSYASSTRTMDPKQILDELVLHPDPKLGIFAGGFRDPDGRPRSYRVVAPDGSLQIRQAKYDGSKLHLYVMEEEDEVRARLEATKEAGGDRLRNVRIERISKRALADHETRMKLRFDEPGVLWVSSRSPAVPHIRDDAYFVPGAPGARYGVEAYYHDGRINAPGARSTIGALIARGDDASRAEAERVLSLLRGTTNVFVNQIGSFGKVLNANLSVYASRSQPPGLTTCIKETYAAWLELAGGDQGRIYDANKWLAWAVKAAKQEYETVWTAPPRVDPLTHLSRYVDEAPSESPEEAPEYYADRDWDAEAIHADGSIREHGWDSHVGALALVGPDKGRIRQHRMLPVCLNSLLYKYEVDLADLSKTLRDPEGEKSWRAKSVERKNTMDRLMWNEDSGLYTDLLVPPGAKDKSEYLKNGYEDLRAFMPMWAGILGKLESSEPPTIEDRRKQRKMVDRVRDFMRRGGLAAATKASWDEAHALNPAYVERCQWGHKDIGWPIATYETVVALRNVGEHGLADEIAYRWCWMVQREMDRSGGLQYSKEGEFEAPITEKMPVSDLGIGGIAEVGYGNQGKGKEGEGGGFRWGYDAYKLLQRSLPKSLADSLANQRDPDLVFSNKVRMAKYLR